MSKKVWSIALCSILTLSIVTGCGQDKDDLSKTSHKGKKSIGIAMPTKSLERWNRDGVYLKENFENAGYDVSMMYSDNDISKQRNDIQGLIDDGVDLLIIAAIDGESLSGVMEETKNAEIPVISYDRLICNTDAVSYYISFDNYKVGQLQGQYIIDEFDLDNADHVTYNMEIMAGDPADHNSTFFFNGAMDTLNPYIDAGIIQIPSGQQDFEQTATAQWDGSVAKERMQNILHTFYSNGEKLDIALCSNDAIALGVTEAILSDYKGKERVIITGQDGDEENLKNILEGKQSMTVYKSVADEAVVTLELAKKILAGETPEEEFCDSVDYDMKYDIETFDNGTIVVPAYLLSPNTVTKDNYRELLIDTGYYTEDANGNVKAVR